MTPLLANSANPWEVPAPVLLNTWKHHAGALRHRIREAAAASAGLDELARAMVVIGTELMDLYTGKHSPAEIAARVLEVLQADGLLSPEAYGAWVEEGGGFRVITFADDATRWVLRRGEESDRYVHVHPARWAPETRRVRANVLKTAVLVLALVAAEGGDPRDLALVNKVRGRYLDLAPLGRELAGDQGIGAVIDVLRDMPE